VTDHPDEYIERMARRLDEGPRAPTEHHPERDHRRRAITPEFAYEVTERLVDLEALLLAICRHLGVDARNASQVVVHGRRVFSPGAGWLGESNQQPRDHDDEPVASDDLAAIGLTEARAALKPTQQHLPEEP
jgi:hypothetical protein